MWALGKALANSCGDLPQPLAPEVHVFTSPGRLGFFRDAKI
jgi:hypothetical protein